jgi:methylase of polypeptide subunit release factors
MLLQGKLHLAPLDNPQEVLDLGTGTGIWAIEFGMPPNPSPIPAKEMHR